MQRYCMTAATIGFVSLENIVSSSQTWKWCFLCHPFNQCPSNDRWRGTNKEVVGSFPRADLPSYYNPRGIWQEYSWTAAEFVEGRVSNRWDSSSSDNVHQSVHGHKRWFPKRRISGTGMGSLFLQILGVKDGGLHPWRLERKADTDRHLCYDQGYPVWHFVE